MKKIKMGKKYRTRCGDPVRILATDLLSDTHTVVAACRDSSGDETVRFYTSTGSWNRNQEEHPFDLVEVKPYKDFKVDDKVFVRNSKRADWEKRHFARITPDGRVLAFMEGKTAWTSVGETAEWVYCIKAE